MKINGACHCGAITYEAEVDPDMSRICHCSDCQTMSGAPYRAIVIVKEENFKILSGTPKIYGLRLGSIKQRDQIRPSGQIWTASAQPWVNELAEIPGIEKQS